MMYPKFYYLVTASVSLDVTLSKFKITEITLFTVMKHLSKSMK